MLVNEDYCSHQLLSWSTYSYYGRYSHLPCLRVKSFTEIVHCESSLSNPKVERAVGEGIKRWASKPKTHDVKLEWCSIYYFERSVNFLHKVVTNIFSLMLCSRPSHQGKTPVNSTKWMGERTVLSPALRDWLPLEDSEVTGGFQRWRWMRREGKRHRWEPGDWKAWHPYVISLREESWGPIFEKFIQEATLSEKNETSHE